MAGLEWAAGRQALDERIHHSGRSPSHEGQADAKQRLERNDLIGLPKLSDGNVSDAARLAEPTPNPTAFYRWLQKSGLMPSLFMADEASVPEERQK